MKIKLNDKDLNRLNSLLKTKEINIAVAELFNEIMQSDISFDDCENIDDVLHQIADIFEMDLSDPETKEILFNHIGKSLSFIDINKYEDNIYKNKVKPGTLKKNYTKIEYLSYQDHSLIPLDEIQVDEKDNFKEYSRLGIINKDFKYLSVTKNNKIWMAIIPNEINTMKPYIDFASGNIITFGLGLGYFAFMVANKKEVKNVTIIEKDESIINLFINHLLPNFIHREKIHIVADDAFLYIKKNPNLKGYDYAFFDLWHDPNDGLPIYLRLQKENFSCPTNYWLEESIIALYRRCFLQVVEDTISNYDMSQYNKSKDEIDRIILGIYTQTKDVTYSKFDDIYKSCLRDNLIKLMKK